MANSGEDTYEIMPDESESSTRKWSVSSETQSQTKFYLSPSPNNTDKPPSQYSAAVGNKGDYYDVSPVSDIYDDTENIDDAVIYKAGWYQM